MIPRPSWTVVAAISLLLAGLATSGVRGTLGLAVHPSTHNAGTGSAGGCSGFVLSGAKPGCMDIASVICNPAGTQDPLTGETVDRDRMAVQGSTTAGQPVVLLFTAVATKLSIGRGAAPAGYGGGAAGGFSLATGVRPDLTLADAATGASIHLSGVAGCY